MDVNAVHELSSRRFHLEMQKSDTWDKARRVAAYLESRLHMAEYLGPLAVAGGCLRDMTLGRTPKDLDIFIDGGAVNGMAHGNILAGIVAAGIGHGAHVTRTLPCYGEWAADVNYVVKIEVPFGFDSDQAEVSGIPLNEVDLIVLNRDRMKAQGYQPASHMTHGTRASFLAAVLARMDLRLNAIGACATSTDSSAYWSDDALMERLVVQYARAGEDVDRIKSRLDRFSDQETGKYPGWAIMYEDGFGEAHSKPVLKAGDGVCS